MKVALVIPTCNRPEYLSQCLTSLNKVKYSENCTIYIIDDASYNVETINMLNKFRPKCNIVVMQNERNMGIKYTLKRAINKAFCDTNDIVINIDSDTIVKDNFIDVLLSLKISHPQNIVTGFNTLSKNEFGAIRHPVINDYEKYCLKKHVGGINLCFNLCDYLNVIYPALLSNSMHWDWEMKSDIPFVVSKPSVIQHIGIVSSLGNVYNPDVAYDF